MAPETVTLIGPSKRISGGKVTLSGKTRPGATVDVYVKGAGAPLATLAADSTTGAYHVTVTVLRNTSYYARTAKAVSGTVTVSVNSSVRITRLALTRRGAGLTVTVKGGPAGRGAVTLWVWKNHRYVKVRSLTSASGIVRFGLSRTKVRTTYRFTYTSPGAYTSSPVSISVKR